MSKTIQDALDLPSIEDLLKAPREKDEGDNITDEMVEAHDSDEDVRTMAIALANGASTDEIMDREQAKDHADASDLIHDEALQHAKDLMDLGYNVDTRSAGRIFENAANMLKIALEAKNAKREAQLKLAKLQVENKKLEFLMRVKSGEPQPTEGVVGEATIVEDRNELIRRMREEAKNNK